MQTFETTLLGDWTAVSEFASWSEIRIGCESGWKWTDGTALNMGVPGWRRYNLLRSRYHRCEITSAKLSAFDEDFLYHWTAKASSVWGHQSWIIVCYTSCCWQMHHWAIESIRYHCQYRPGARAVQTCFIRSRVQSAGREALIAWNGSWQ